MIQSFVVWIESLIVPWGAWGVFIGSIIEEVIAIIPSSVVQMGAGFLLLSDEPFSGLLLLKALWLIVLPAAIGVTVGSLAIYALAYWGGRPLIERHGKYLALRWSDIERIRQRFSLTISDELIILIGRALPVMPTVAVTAFAGIFRIRLRKYLAFTFIGTALRAAILSLIGWQAGALYHEYAQVIGHYEDLVLGLIVAAVVGFLIYHQRSRLNQRS